MSKWSRLDPWSEDDSAVARMREALERPRTPETPQVATDTAPIPPSPPDESSPRRRRIAELLARLRAGDPAARQQLEDLLR